MYRHVVVIALVLVAIAPVTLATNHNTGGDQVSQANKFLSAEVQRAIKQEGEEIEENLKTYQDENFRALDARVNTFINEALWKMALVGGGSGLIVMGIGALVIARVNKKYQMSPQDEDVGYDEREAQAMSRQQESEWYPQDQPQTVATDYGQSEAGTMSQMNEWQAKPAYQDAWKAPVEVESELSSTDRMQQQYQQSNPEWQEQYDREYQEFDEYDEDYGEYQEQGYEENVDDMEEWAQQMLDDEEDEWYQ